MPHTLLLADDSATIQRVVELTFANEDIDVVTVGDGALAIEAIARQTPDIVLADVSMPGKDGYDVASFMRSDPARARIPVVLLTGAFEPLDQVRCDAIGSHDVLVKPFEPREVIGKVRALLDLPATGAPDVPATAVEEALAQEAAAGEALAAPAGDGAAAPAADAELAVDAASAVDAAAVADSAAAPAVDDASPAVDAAAAAAVVVPEATPVEDPPAEPPAAAAASPPTTAAGSAPPAPPAAEAASGATAPVPPAGTGGAVLAQSFLTFLAVEQGADPPALAPARTGEDAGRQARVLQEALMDDLVNRVVERLTETVLRDTVAEVVSRLTERLAREQATPVAPGRE